MATWAFLKPDVSNTAFFKIPACRVRDFFMLINNDFKFSTVVLLTSG